MTEDLEDAAPDNWWAGAVVPGVQRWKKMAAAAALHVLVFHSCAIFLTANADRRTVSFTLAE